MIYTDNRYIYIPAGVFASSLAKKSFSRQAAYIDIILMGEECCGIITTSVKELSQRWGWAYDRTFIFIQRLPNKGFCEVLSSKGDVTIIIKGQPESLV